MRYLLFYLALACALVAQATKVGAGAGVTKVGAGAGVTKVAATVSAFTPNSIASIVAWYNSPVAGATNGATFSPWPDSATAHSFPLSQATSGDRATYRTAQVNGQDSAQFVAATPCFYDTGGSSASTFPYTFWAVVNIPDTNNPYSIFGGSTNTGGIQWRIDSSTGFLTLNEGGVAGIGTGNVAVTTGSYHLLIATVDSGNWAFYIDGTAAGSGTHSTTLGAGHTIIMGASSGSGEPFNGFIAEGGILSTVATSTERGNLTAYEKTKYGIP